MVYNFKTVILYLSRIFVNIFSEKYAAELEQKFLNELVFSTAMKFVEILNSKFSNALGIKKGKAVNDLIANIISRLKCEVCDVFNYEIDHKVSDFPHGFDFTERDDFENLNHPLMKLLFNNGWEWALWLSHQKGVPMSSFIIDTLLHFNFLWPKYNSGYGFDGCKTLIDLLQADSLVCPIENFSDLSIEDLPFLKNMYCKKILHDGQTFKVTLSRISNAKTAMLEAEESIIQRLWQEMAWHTNTDNPYTFPCLESYSQLGVPGYIDRFYMDFGDYLITGCFDYGKRPTNIQLPRHETLVLIFPEEVDECEFQSFVRESEDTEKSITAIMNCKRVEYTLKQIYRYKQKTDLTCTREGIRSEYERLMRSYLEAVKYKS